uniref:Uncharacterized protein n=1 Tax=viral metagenome TaxID=1070528 RepID=A0A6C0B9L3_9ZZZZ
MHLRNRSRSRKYKRGAGPKKTATMRKREADLARERKVQEREVQERANALIRNRKEREREARLQEIRDRVGFFEEPKEASADRGFFGSLYESSSSEKSSSSKKSSSNKKLPRPNLANIPYSEFAKQTPKERNYDKRVYQKLDEMDNAYRAELKDNERHLRSHPSFAFEENTAFGLKEEVPRQKTGAVTAIGKLGFNEQELGPTNKKNDYDDDNVLAYDLNFKGGKTKRRRTKQFRKRKTKQSRKSKRHV